MKNVISMENELVSVALESMSVVCWHDEVQQDETFHFEC